MKCSVDIKELQNAVKLLTPIVNVNNSTVSLRHLKIRKVDDKLEITGYNSNIFASVYVTVYNLTGDDISYVFAKTFFDLVKAFNGTVELVISPESFHIKSEKSKYKVGTLDKDFFVSEIPEDPDHYSIKFNKTGIKFNDFKINAKSIMHCLSEDRSQLALQHIYFKDGIMIASDGVRGAIIGGDYKALNGYMLHKDIINCIMNIEEASLMYFKIEDDILQGMIGNFIFTLSLAGVAYPYEDIIKLYNEYNKRTFNIVIPVKQSMVLDALSRLILLADKETNAINVVFYPNYISFSVEGNSSGEEIVHIGDINIKEPVSLHVDAKNLRDALLHSLGEIYWKTDNSEDMQYIVDSDMVQFFFGLNS